MRFQILAVVCILIAAISVSGCLQSTEKTTDEILSKDHFRSVTDSRGVEVMVPADIERVATVSDGLVEEVMFILGVDDTLVGLGSNGLLSESVYQYPLDDGGEVTVTGGKNVALVLSPHLKDLPLFIDYGVAMNVETLASLEPDVVIMRLGSSALLGGRDETAQKSIDIIESLGIPVVVLYSPNCYEDSDPTAISEEIRIIARVFGKDDTAEKIISALDSHSTQIRERTQDVSEEEKPTVLIFGLSPMHRTETAAGIAWGLKTTDSYLIEEIINAKNAYRSNTGSFQVVSTEQVLSMNPDVIILGTAAGYHPPEELYCATYYTHLRELSAVQNHYVTALPYAPRNAARRLEYPLDLMVMAKTVYPDRFEDVKMDEWMLAFYREVYGVDEKKAKEICAAQLMDWCIEESGV